MKYINSLENVRTDFVVWASIQDCAPLSFNSCSCSCIHAAYSGRHGMVPLWCMMPHNCGLETVHSCTCRTEVGAQAAQSFTSFSFLRSCVYFPPLITSADHCSWFEKQKYFI